MAKPSKSPTPEFLAKRRKTIAEMASRRRQKQLLKASGISIQGPTTKANKVAKVIAPVAHRGRPSATSQG